MKTSPVLRAGAARLGHVGKNVAALSIDDRALVMRALRVPRGRYSAERASQLSAVPARTLHDWATSGMLLPDWSPLPRVSGTWHSEHQVESEYRDSSQRSGRLVPWR